MSVSGRRSEFRGKPMSALCLSSLEFGDQQFLCRRLNMGIFEPKDGWQRFGPGLLAVREPEQDGLHIVEDDPSISHKSHGRFTDDFFTT